MGIIVYGPQGSGKNQEAGEKIAKHFGLRFIELPDPGEPLPDDAIVFADSPKEGALDFFKLMAEIDAISNK